MKSCLTCGVCYVDPTNGLRDSYRCMRGVRPPINDLFTLARVSCEKYVEVEIKIEVK